MAVIFAHDERYDWCPGAAISVLGFRFLWHCGSACFAPGLVKPVSHPESKQDARKVFFLACLQALNCPHVFALASGRGERFDHDRLFRRPLAWVLGLLESIITWREKVDTSLWEALPRIL